MVLSRWSNTMGFPGLWLRIGVSTAFMWWFRLSWPFSTVIMITYLHHTDPILPHYRGKEWNFQRGAAATVDRDFLGWQGRFFLHDVAHYHVIHHVCFTPNLYNLVYWFIHSVLSQDAVLWVSTSFPLNSVRRLPMWQIMDQKLPSTWRRSLATITFVLINRSSKLSGITIIIVNSWKTKVGETDTALCTWTEGMLGDIVFYRDKKGQAVRRPADRYMSKTRKASRQSSFDEWCDTYITQFCTIITTINSNHARLRDIYMVNFIRPLLSPFACCLGEWPK